MLLEHLPTPKPPSAVCRGGGLVHRLLEGDTSRLMGGGLRPRAGKADDDRGDLACAAKDVCRQIGWQGMARDSLGGLAPHDHHLGRLRVELVDDRHLAEKEGHAA